MYIENAIFTAFCVFLAFFLKPLYTYRFPLKSVLLNEFAKKGDTFESCYIRWQCTSLKISPLLCFM